MCYVKQLMDSGLKNVNRSKEGKPLTCIQYQKDVWNKFVWNSKQSSLSVLQNYSRISDVHLEEISKLKFHKTLTYELGNIQIDYSSDDQNRPKFVLSSMGSEEKHIPMIQHIYSTPIHSAWQMKNTEN